MNLSKNLIRKYWLWTHLWIGISAGLILAFIGLTGALLVFVEPLAKWENGDILFPENIGPYLSIDETSLSQGELYTVLTNKEAKGKKGAIVAIIKGTDSDTVIDIMNKIGLNLRRKVKEITLDMASSMELIAKYCFPRAIKVTDRFHVQKLATEAVQEIRIKYRWQAIDQENREMELAKEQNKVYKADILENGDTHRQLLARSRYLLFKSADKWTVKQVHRAEVLFKYYPEIETAYKLSQKLSKIYTHTKVKEIALTKLAKWYNEVELSGIKSFETICRTIQQHYQHILNYFERRSTNASAESFNAKIKSFRAQFRGVRNVKFFLFRLSKIYA